MDEKELAEIKTELKWIKGLLVEVRHDIKLLEHHKWKITGGATVISVIITLLVEYIHK